MTPFVHLRLHSAYSLAEGAIKIEKLVHLCEENKMPAVAVTDTNNLFGGMEFCIKCADHGIQPIVACQLNIQHPTPTKHPTSVLLYAQNKNGYQNLIQLISNAYLHPSSNLHPEISLNLFEKYSQDIILATGGAEGSLGAFILENNIDEAKEYLQYLNKYFENRLYVEVSRHNKEVESLIEEKMISLAYDFNLPLLATNNVCYATPEDFEAHDVLICISQIKTIYDSERQTSFPDYYFKTQQEMNELFHDLPEALENSVHIAERCSFMLTKQKPLLPVFKTESGKSQDDELEDMARHGLEEKLSAFANEEDYEQKRKTYFDRLKYELGVIKTMGFSGYFLIVADYVRWAKSQSIPVGPGRGSGAGSIVAWSIHITDVDPIRFKLFFERFLNPDRVSMPDFDIDFCQARREEVIEYVQRKYGYQSVAQITTFGKLQAKAVIKDVGRVLAMPYGFVDKISKLIPFSPTNPLTLQEGIDREPVLQDLIKTDPQVQKLTKIALRLEGLYRNPGVHAAGVVISDKNLQDIVPLYKDAKSDMPSTQFSTKYVESASLIKFDFLGLKTLTVIQKAIDLINKRGIELTSHSIPLDDKKTFDLIKAVNCVGVFQIESGGMKDVVKKLQPDRIEDIIALVALYRPGPMDDIPKYIACKHGLEKISYLHEKLIPILEETYGVMVYQEQVMQIAQSMGGYSLGQADILRRAMGKKNKEEMQAQKKRFIDGAVERGIDRSIAEKLFEQMSKFASYGFNKSHSTPYGLLTYQTAFLKANYMMEFYVAIMTLDMANADKLFAYYQDAKSNGIKIAPPDINLSEGDFIIDYENGLLRYSLAAIKGAGIAVVNEIVKERKINGDYTSVFDFIERNASKKIINRKIFENFIKAGVFDSLHPNRRQLFDSLDNIMSVKVSEDQFSLFQNTYPDLKKVSEWSESEKLQYEFAVIGFYVSAHPLEQYESIIQKFQFPLLSEAAKFSRTKVVAVINNVTVKTTKNQNKFAVLNVSDISGTAEVTLFGEVYNQNREVLEVGNIVLIQLNCFKNDGQTRFSAESIQKFDKNYNGEDNLVKKAYRPQGYFKPKLLDMTLRITISDQKGLLGVKSLISKFKKNGNYSVELKFPEEKRTLVLPEKYNLSSYDVLDVREVVGIDNVVEIQKG
ncbi:MAG: DNA polymerase III subunit alpha [Alphaproteobacteria bacterium]|nr:DNA polymerase III subunit alpha [Alphaproteobacteria bacterium]